VLAHFVEAIAAGLEQIVHAFGLPGIVLIALMENLFPPTPSEFLYPLAGKLAYDGKLTALGIIAAGTLGSLIGSLTYYSLGYWLGEDRTRRAIVLVARLVPLVHSVVSIPAGVIRMRLIPFIVYTVLGSVMWIAPLTLLGWWLGSNWERILNWMAVYQNIWYAVMGLFVAYWIGRRIRRWRATHTHDDSAGSGD
jgi:membrane protein DedA with SNARE-associated domain